MKIACNLLYSVLFFIISSFSVEDKKTVIHVTCNECMGMNLSLSTVNLLRNTPKELYRSTFTSSGTVHIQFTHTDTINVFLRIGENDSLSKVSTPLYLEPGTGTNLLYSNGVLTFEGDLKLVNSYNYKLLKPNIERGDYINANSHKYRQGSDREKEIYFAMIRSFGEEINQIITEDQSLPNYYKRFLINSSYSSEMTQRLFFDFEKSFALKSSKGMNVVQDPISQNIFNEFTLNPYLLQNSLYLLGVRQHLGLKIESLWEYYDENVGKIKTSRYEYIKSAIKSNLKLTIFQELILALSITHISYWDWISYDDLSDFTQSFEKDYPRSKYLLELHEILAEHSELRKGTPMRDFTMQDVNGKEFKLSDLKGSLIYIDVWATWCGPCREEFRHSIKLTKKYDNRTDLKFIYVSVDSKQELWKSFLKKNPLIKGIHGIQSSGKMRSDSSGIISLYKINGIPRYILIDKDGKIVDSNAARPSELLANNYLDSLLKL